MAKERRLLDEYQYPGFRPMSKIQGIFGDPKARIIRLRRTQKKQHVVAAGRHIAVITTKPYGRYETCPVEMPESIWKWKSGGSTAKSVAK